MSTFGPSEDNQGADNQGADNQGADNQGADQILLKWSHQVRSEDIIS